MNALRRLFGPSREEIWRQLSAEIGAQYVHGGCWTGDKVQASHGAWTVTLDCHTQVVSTGKTTTAISFTRMRAPYVNPDGFRFKISRRGFWSDLGKWFGMQDVEVGHPDVDRDFIIQGNDEAKLRALFADARLRELLSSQESLHLSVKDDEGWFGARFPEGVDELHFMVTGVIKDLERLKRLYALFAETLDQLCRIGAAGSGAPDVTL